MMKRSYALIGFQSTGKTTLGKILAENINSRFVDTDQLIEMHHPELTCREISLQMGHDYFRRLESQVIHSLVFEPPLVLATGGGSLLETQNASVLKSNCTLIYLKTSAHILKERIWQRPFLPSYVDPDHPEQSLYSLHEERSLQYEKWADHTIEMDGLTIDEALKQLIIIID